jgi:hypothetical protein
VRPVFLFFNLSKGEVKALAGKEEFIAVCCNWKPYVMADGDSRTQEPEASKRQFVRVGKFNRRNRRRKK